MKVSVGREKLCSVGMLVCLVRLAPHRTDLLLMFVPTRLLMARATSARSSWTVRGFGTRAALATEMGAVCCSAALALRYARMDRIWNCHVSRVLWSLGRRECRMQV